MSSYVLLCPPMSFHVLPCPPMPSHVLACPPMSDLPMSSHVLLCPPVFPLSCHVLPCPPMSSNVLQCPTFPCPPMSSMSSYVLSCPEAAARPLNAIYLASMCFCTWSTLQAALCWCLRCRMQRNFTVQTLCSAFLGASVEFFGVVNIVLRRACCPMVFLIARWMPHLCVQFDDIALVCVVMECVGLVGCCCCLCDIILTLCWREARGGRGCGWGPGALDDFAGAGSPGLAAWRVGSVVSLRRQTGSDLGLVFSCLPAPGRLRAGFEARKPKGRPCTHVRLCVVLC